MTDFINDMDVLQTEHLANKAAEEAKAQAAREAARETDRKASLARYEEARKARITRQLPTLIAIKNAVSPEHVVALDEDTGILTIDRQNVSYDLTFREERTALSKWRSAPNGKTRLIVGDYGNRRSFPEQKGGKHNYAEIARLLTGIAVKKNAMAQLERQRSENSKTVAALKTALFPNATNGYCDVVSPSATPEYPVQFRFNINHAVSHNEALAIAKVLREAGIALHYTDNQPQRKK